MRPLHPSNPQSRLTTLAAAAGLIAIFYFGREVLIPLALSVLISFLLVPAVRRLERLRVGRIAAVALVALLALVPLVLVGWVVALQFIDVATTLPDYQTRIEHKLDSIKIPHGGALDRIRQSLTELSREAALPSAETPAPGATAPPEPLPVRVVSGPMTPVEIAHNFVQPLARPLATTGIVIVFVIVILIHRADLRDRLIRIIGRGHLTVTTRALDELAERVSRFLRMQFLVNLSYGITIAIGLFVIGIPTAIFWGFMCMALRFVPYLGPVLGAAMPIALSLAVSDGWSMPIETAALFIVIELISNNLVEPWLYGKKTGVSVLAVLVSAVFWAWLWGLPGLFLSTPMTVCLVVAGRYVPQLAFLDILLGDQPPLPPWARIYQRLLAMDADEALEVADEYLADHPLEQLYDSVLVEVLRSAGADRADGTLDPARERFVFEALRDIADEAAARPSTESVPPDPARPDLRTLCIPARDDGDAAAGHMLAHLLGARGLTARAMSVEDLGSDLAAVMAEFRPELLVISAAEPHAASRARLRVRQVLRRAPGARVVVGLWGSDTAGPPSASRARLATLGAAEVAGSLAEAAESIARLATLPGTRPDPAPAPLP